MILLVVAFTVLSSFIETVAFAAEATRLRVVMVSDGVNSARRGADLKSGCDGNILYLKDFLAEALKNREDRYTLNGDPDNVTEQRALNGAEVTPDSVMQFLQGPEFVVAPTESILFYYCGHGAMEERRDQPAFGRHFFLMGMAGPQDRGILARDDVRNVLLQKKAKAVYIIADACSNYQAVEPVAGAPENTPDFLAFYELFFRADGLVDVLAAAPGQRAWFDRSGGMFTSALVEVFYQRLDKLKEKGVQEISWRGIFPLVQRTTNEKFLDLKNRSLVPAGAEADPNSIVRFNGQTPAFYNPPAPRR